MFDFSDQEIAEQRVLWDAVVAWPDQDSPLRTQMLPANCPTHKVSLEIREGEWPERGSELPGDSSYEVFTTIRCPACDREIAHYSFPKLPRVAWDKLITAWRAEVRQQALLVFYQHEHDGWRALDHYHDVRERKRLAELERIISSCYAELGAIKAKRATREATNG